MSKGRKGTTDRLAYNENTALLSDKVYESYFEGKPVKIL